MVKYMNNKLQKAIMNPELIQPWLNRNLHMLPHNILNGRYSLNPMSIGISVNSVCNLKCVMCDVGQKNTGSQFYEKLSDKSDLGLDVIKNVIMDVKGFKPIININSTEPLLYKDLPEVIEIIKKCGLKCTITTNGYLLEKHAEYIVEMGLDNLSVSIDGPDKVHDMIRGVNGAFRRAINGIKKVNEIKDVEDTPYPQILVNSTISQYNVGSPLLELADIAYDLNVNHLQFGHLNFITDEMAREHNEGYGDICKINSSSVSSMDLNEIDINELIETIQLLKNKWPSSFCSFYPEMRGDEIYVYYKNPEKFIKNDKCFKPWLNTQILSNGTVVPGARCAFNIEMGNVNDRKFRDIWNGYKYKEFRLKLKKVGATSACTRCCGIF